MKSLIPFILAFLFTGCSWMVQDRIILMPNGTYYPTFPIEEFKKAEPCDYDMWPLQFDDDNKSYFFSEQAPTIKCSTENKQNRSDLNLIIKKIKDFNVKIELENQKQREKKPTIVK